MTDKGVPAALVMAATRSVLRASAQRLVDPGVVLERVNEHLCPDMPAKMFVTCLYGVLEPATGACASPTPGTTSPTSRPRTASCELRARGMPLGLMPGMDYEEKEAVLAPGDSVLLHSDGIVEAHAPDRDMFGFPRLKDAVGRHPGGGELIDRVLEELARFTGPGAEQEDDITMVTLQRAAGRRARGQRHAAGRRARRVRAARAGPATSAWRSTACARRSPRWGSGGDRVERLGTAVGEATMNAMEHGNGYRDDRPVTIRVVAEPGRLRVEITDLGGARRAPGAEVPDLEAKLAGLQRPRGWGLFLIEHMVDETRETGDDRHHTVELSLRLEGDGDDHT